MVVVYGAVGPEFATRVRGRACVRVRVPLIKCLTRARPQARPVPIQKIPVTGDIFLDKNLNP